MRSFFNLLLALIIVIVFGGTAYLLTETSKNSHFERADKPSSILK